MNYLVGFFALVFSVLFGYKLAASFTDKKEFYNEFTTFNKILKNEISFSQKTIKEIVSNKDTESEFYKCVRDYYSTGDFSVEKFKIDKTEKEFLITYLENIGKSDRETQIKFLESVTETINEKFSSAESDEKKYKTLYIKLSFLFGLLIFIILL